MTGLTGGTGERQAAGMIAGAVPLGLGTDDHADLGAEFFSDGRVSRDDEHIGIAGLARRTKAEHPEIVVII